MLERGPLAFLVQELHVLLLADDLGPRRPRETFLKFQRAVGLCPAPLARSAVRADNSPGQFAQNAKRTSFRVSIVSLGGEASDQDQSDGVHCWFELVPWQSAYDT